LLEQIPGPLPPSEKIALLRLRVLTQCVPKLDFKFMRTAPPIQLSPLHFFLGPPSFSFFFARDNSDLPFASRSPASQVILLPWATQLYTVTRSEVYFFLRRRLNLPSPCFFSLLFSIKSAPPFFLVFPCFVPLCSVLPYSPTLQSFSFPPSHTTVSYG